MSDRAARVTIADVAAEAGVSTATAGRVLGNYGYVGAELRQRVLSHAAALGYRPNGLARSLITGRTHTIGVVLGDVQSPFYAAVLHAISKRLRAAGYGILITTTDDLVASEVSAVHLLLSRQVEGLIVAPSCDLMGEPKHLAAAARAVPLVQIDRIAGEVAGDAVVVDNRGAAAQAVAVLTDAGHRRIAILFEPETEDEEQGRAITARIVAGEPMGHLAGTNWQRLLGYADALRHAGIALDAALIARVGCNRIDGARDLTAALLDGPDRPTALFTADGLMSQGAMATLVRLGLAVPRDLSLVCFDDLDWMSFLSPGVTAVAQPLEALGEKAADLLLARIAAPHRPPEQFVMSPRLHRRGSVAPPPG